MDACGLRVRAYIYTKPRQQKFRAMNGAHLASPIWGELGYAHWPQLVTQFIGLLGTKITICSIITGSVHGRRPGAEFGGRKKFRGLFRAKFPFSRRKILMTFFFFLVIDQVFSDFDSLFSDYLCLYCIKCHI